MTEPPSAALAHSIVDRLRKLASADGANFQSILERFAVERLLYRLSRSPMRECFILKGATVFLAWGGEIQRPSRDLDMLSCGPNGIDDLIESFRAIVAQPVEPDGLVFHVDEIKGSRIKEGQEYEGVRLVFHALLGKARIPLQVDVGFGDAVQPAPLEGDFPTLLKLPAPNLWFYPREAVIAEKFQAMVALGMTNSRMKDFYDLWTLSRTFAFEGQALCEALQATFSRRKTALPIDMPDTLTAAFATHVNAAWRAFVGKTSQPATNFAGEVQPALVAFLLPAARAAREGAGAALGTWTPPGPWQAVSDGSTP